MYIYIVYKLQLAQNLLNVIYIHDLKHAVILTCVMTHKNWNKIINTGCSVVHNKFYQLETQLTV